MNLPNKLTVSRLVLTVVFVVLFYVPWQNRVSLALIVFAIASITDYLDGNIARKRGLVTNFGKLLDPVADKVLLGAALVLLAAGVRHTMGGIVLETRLEDRLLPAWTVVVVLAREFIVTGIRLIAASSGTVLAAEKLGKHKTVWQIITVVYFMLRMASEEPLFRWTRPAFDWWILSPQIIGVVCITMMTALTVISGLSYFWKNRAMFDDA
jgi:CDP-diacylglycerol---glycerol-3-phosphate 3-phosphatidyltransferase